tara:strand:- start:259 stop:489 length:231 start_codon:yes stop_codon:yes gene_type:complete
MVFENTYLMLLYFQNKKKIISKKRSTKVVSFNDESNVFISDIENKITNDCLIHNNDSDETLDNRCYPYNQKNIVLK